MNKVLVLNFPLSIIRFFDWKVSFKFLWYLVIFGIIFFLIFYIFQINALMSENYQIQNSQERIDKLINENKILEINSFQNSSLENIENKIKDLGFEKIDKAYYIQILENQMVSK